MAGVAESDEEVVQEEDSDYGGGSSRKKKRGKKRKQGKEKKKKKKKKADSDVSEQEFEEEEEENPKPAKRGRKSKGREESPPPPAKEESPEPAMPTAQQVCEQWGLNDVDLQYGEADYQNLTTFKLFQQTFRPRIQAENPKVSMSKLMMLVAASSTASLKVLISFLE